MKQIRKNFVISFFVVLFTTFLCLNLFSNFNDFNLNYNPSQEQQAVCAQQEVFNTLKFRNRNKISKIRNLEQNNTKKQLTRNWNTDKTILKDKLNNNYVLYNYYFSYYLNNPLIKNEYNINSYMLIYSNSETSHILSDEQYVEDFSLEYSLETSDGSYYTIMALSSKSTLTYTQLNINTKNEQFNKFISNHFFILKYKFKFQNSDSLFWLSGDIILELIDNNDTHYYWNNTSFNKTIDSFKLSYDLRFYYSQPKFNVSNFVLQENGVATFELNFLVPTGETIDSSLSKLKVTSNYKSIDNKNHMNDYKLNFIELFKPYQYGVSSWYHLYLSVNNLSKEGGYLYSNFNFYFENKVFYLKGWNQNLQFITPTSAPEIDFINTKKISTNSIQIDIKYNRSLNYNEANNLMIKTNQGDIILKNPYVVGEKNDEYIYQIDGLQGEYNNCVIYTTGYYEYSYFSSKFVKSYDKNNFFININVDFIYKTFLFENNNLEIPKVLNYRVINNYSGEGPFLQVTYDISSNVLINDPKINKIKLSYKYSYETNMQFSENYEWLYASSVSKDYKNDTIVDYKINNLDYGTIYKDVSFTIPYNNNYTSNNSYDFHKNIYITKFTNSGNIDLIQMNKVDSNSITFEATFNNTDKLQAELLQITYLDSKGISHNTIQENNLKFNKIISEDPITKEITYQFTLFNLDNNTNYYNFNFYLPKDISQGYGEVIKLNYYDESSYNISSQFVTRKISFQVRNIILIISISLLYLALFLYFIFSFLKFRRKI